MVQGIMGVCSAREKLPSTALTLRRQEMVKNTLTKRKRLASHAPHKPGKFALKVLLFTGRKSWWCRRGERTAATRPIAMRRRRGESMEERRLHE